LIDPADICLYWPPNIGRAKQELYEKIGASVGRVTRSTEDLVTLRKGMVPAIGCSQELAYLIVAWRKVNRPFIYWDRGYLRRIFTTWLPKGENGGYYRWHVDSFQMQRIREVPADRFEALEIPVPPWRQGGDKIVVAPSLPDYDATHLCRNWVERLVARLRLVSTRPVVVRHRDSNVPLEDELADAHCLVTHGSNAANEAVIMGCPVITLGDCAAALVGRRSLEDLENLVRPDRRPWLQSLAYSQFTESEILDGTVWRLMDDRPG
jgi:hypothetical protein